jgi:HlyD family secretion protein
VDEFYLGRLRAGQGATGDIGGRDCALTIERVYPQVRDGSFVVDLKFAGAAPEGLLPGQSVQGKFSLGTATSATLLAAGPFLQHSGGDWVFVLDGDSAVRRRIRVGRRNAEQLEIIAGLAAGERVITSDYQGYGGIDRIELQ